MFDLNEALAEWRRNLVDMGSLRREDLDELESHLQEEIDQHLSTGLQTQEAFQLAVCRVGDFERLGEE